MKLVFATMSFTDMIVLFGHEDTCEILNCNEISFLFHFISNKLSKGWPSLSRKRTTLVRSIVFKMLIVQYFVRIRKKSVHEEVEATSSYMRHDFHRTNQLPRKSIILKTIDRSSVAPVRRPIKAEVSLDTG